MMEIIRPIRCRVHLEGSPTVYANDPDGAIRAARNDICKHHAMHLIAEVIK